MDKKLWKQTYDKYDGRYDDLVTHCIQLKKENNKLKTITKKQFNEIKRIMSLSIPDNSKIYWLNKDLFNKGN